MAWDGIERRKGGDFWIKLFRLLSLIGWISFTVALVLSFYATPEQEFGLTRFHQIEVRKHWLSPLTDYLYILLWVTAGFSLISIFISHFRIRRATDDKYYNFWLLFLICITWAIYIAFEY